MTGNNDRRPPAVRPLARLAGGAALLVLLAVLAAVGGLVWWLQAELPAGADRTTRENDRLHAQSLARGLSASAHDGELTDEEITRTLRTEPWAVRRTDRAIRVVATTTPALGSEPAVCWAFTLGLPLGPDTSVRTAPHPDSCPERRPEAG